MGNNRVILVGAVHEAMEALLAIHEDPAVDLVAVVTLDEDAARTVSGSIDLAGAASAIGVPVIRVHDVNDEDAVRAIAALTPGVLVVVGWTRLIKDDLLALPTHGCVGFHASLLPRNRGRAPVNWAILRGETVTGNTMMLLDAGIDTGRILDQESTPIYADDTCATVYERVAASGGRMLQRNLIRLVNGTAQPTIQDDLMATLLPKRVPSMGVTDWRRPPVDIHNWVRAQTWPYPGAFTNIAGQRLTLWKSVVPTFSPYAGRPGEILGIEGETIRVAAGDGSILISEVGTTTTQRLSAAEWLSHSAVTVGDCFDVPDDALVAWSLGLGPRPATEGVN